MASCVKSSIRNIETKTAFKNVCEWIESQNGKQLSLNEVEKQMKMYSSNSSYSKVWLTKLLKRHFGDKVIFSVTSGKTQVLTFTETASNILCASYQDTTDVNESLQEVENVASF